MQAIGVLMACLGVAAAMWGATGSVRWAASGGGFVLFALSVLLLIELGDEGGAQ